jgi:hypothetical protein
MNKGDEAMNYSKILILVRFLNKSAHIEKRPQHWILVQNWFEELKRLVPTN